MLYVSRLSVIMVSNMDEELPDGENLAKVKVHVIDLSDENSCHSLVESGAIHVDGGPDRQDEACHTFIHTVVLLQTAEGDGQGGRTAQKQQQTCNITKKNLLGTAALLFPFYYVLVEKNKNRYDSEQAS